jgi:hypothetical protein
MQSSVEAAIAGHLLAIWKDGSRTTVLQSGDGVLSDDPLLPVAL